MMDDKKNFLDFINTLNLSSLDKNIYVEPQISVPTQETLEQPIEKSTTDTLFDIKNFFDFLRNYDKNQITAETDKLDQLIKESEQAQFMPYEKNKFIKDIADVSALFTGNILINWKKDERGNEWAYSPITGREYLVGRYGGFLKVPSGAYRLPDKGAGIAISKPVDITTGFGIGALSGFTFGIPEKISTGIYRATHKGENIQEFYPISNIGRLAMGGGHLVGFLHSPLMKLLHKITAAGIGKLFPAEHIVSKIWKGATDLTSNSRKLKTIFVTGFDNILNASINLGTAFAISEPLGKTLPEDLKNRLKAFAAGALTGTFFEMVGMINPEFISYFKAKTPAVGFINSESTPFLYNIARAGIAASADLLYYGVHDRPIEDIVFQTGLNLYFGWHTYFSPYKFTKRIIVEYTREEIESLKKNVPEVAKEFDALEQKLKELLDKSERKPDEIKTWAEILEDYREAKDPFEKLRIMEEFQITAKYEDPKKLVTEQMLELEKRVKESIEAWQHAKPQSPLEKIFWKNYIDRLADTILIMNRLKSLVGLKTEIPENYTTSVEEWAKSVNERRFRAYIQEKPEETTTFYHVTTAGPKVTAEGLKPVVAVKKTALGGSDSDTVSVTYNSSHAERIAEILKIHIRVAKGELSIGEILEQFSRASNYDRLLSDTELLHDFLNQIGVWQELVDYYESEHNKDLKALSFDELLKIKPKNFGEIQKFYELTQEIDMTLRTYNDNWVPVCVLTEPQIIREINPNNIKILQVAVRKGANPVYHNPFEYEFAFYPDDLYVVSSKKPYANINEYSYELPVIFLDRKTIPVSEAGKLTEFMESFIKQNGLDPYYKFILPELFYNTKFDTIVSRIKDGFTGVYVVGNGNGQPIALEKSGAETVDYIEKLRTEAKKQNLKEIELIPVTKVNFDGFRFNNTISYLVVSTIRTNPKLLRKNKNGTISISTKNLSGIDVVSDFNDNAYLYVLQDIDALKTLHKAVSEYKFTRFDEIRLEYYKKNYPDALVTDPETGLVHNRFMLSNVAPDMEYTQTNYDRIKKTKKIGQFFGDTKTEKELYWTKERTENEYATPENGKIPLLNALIRKINISIQEMVRKHNSKGGLTYNLFAGDMFGKDLYAVSIFPERSLVINGRPLTHADIIDFINRNIDLLVNPHYNIGTWHDTSTGVVYLDVSYTTPNKEKALALAKAFRQKSIYYLKNGTTIDVPPDTIPAQASKSIQHRTLTRAVTPNNRLTLIHFSDLNDPIAWLSPQATKDNDIYIENKPEKGLKDNELPYLSFYTAKSRIDSNTINKLNGKSIYQVTINKDDLYVVQLNEKIPNAFDVVFAKGKIGILLPNGEVRLYIPIRALRIINKIPVPMEFSYTGNKILKWSISQRTEETKRLMSDEERLYTAVVSDLADAISKGKKPSEIPLKERPSTSMVKHTDKERAEAHTKNEIMLEDMLRGMSAEQISEAFNSGRILKCPDCKRYMVLSPDGDKCPHCGKDVGEIRKAFVFYMSYIRTENPEELKEFWKNAFNPDDPHALETFIENAVTMEYIKRMSIPMENEHGIEAFLQVGKSRSIVKLDNIPIPQDAKLPDIIEKLPDDLVIATSGISGQGVSITVGELKRLIKAKEMKAKTLSPFKPQIWMFEENLDPMFKELFYYKARDFAYTMAKDDQALRELLKSLGKITAEEDRRLAIYAYWQQPLARKTLQAHGITAPPVLTPKEQAIYDKVTKEILPKWLVRINMARTKLGLKPIEGEEFYFPIIREMLVNPEMLPEVFFGVDPMEVFKRIKIPSNPFLKERVYNLNPIKFAFVDNLALYWRKTSRYVNAADLIATAKLYLSPIVFKVNNKMYAWSMREQLPKTYNYLTQYVNAVTALKRPSVFKLVEHTPFLRQLLQVLHRNLSAAILSFNARSAAIQPFSIRNALTEVSPLDIAWAASKMFNPKYRKFVMENSRHMLARNADVVFQEFKDALDSLPKGLRTYAEITSAISQYGLLPLKLLDLAAAEVTWLAAYRKGLRLGLKGQELYRYCDDVTIRSQASGNIEDISVIQRLPEARIFMLFQTFTLNEWNVMKRSLRAFWKKGEQLNAQAWFDAFKFLVYTTIFNMFAEDVLKIRSPFPTPIRAAYKQSKLGNHPIDVAREVIRELGEQVPIIGGSIRWSTPYKVNLPAILQAYVDGTTTIMKLLNAKSFSAIDKDDLFVFGRILGLPASSQIEKYIRRRNRGANVLEALIGINIDDISPYNLTEIGDRYRKYYNLER